MLSEYVADIFHHHINATMQCAEVNTEIIATAAEHMVACMLSEGKIFCCGEGSQATQASYLAACLLNRFQYDRPSLPAINLAGDAVVVSAISSDSNYNEVYAKQLQALGQAGDIAFICHPEHDSATVVKAIQAAHERDMTVIALCNSENRDANPLLTGNDIEICIPHNNQARVMELQLLIINCLCELIDMQLFGAES